MNRTQLRRSWGSSDQASKPVNRGGRSNSGGMSVSQAQSMFNMFQSQSLSRINAINQSRNNGINAPSSSGAYGKGNKLMMLDNR